MLKLSIHNQVGVHCGGILGINNSVTEITNTYNDGEITGSHYLGGILGRAYEGSVTIRRCSNNNRITQINATYTAGIVGSANSQTQIIKCINTGEIINTSTTSSDAKRIGGIVASTSGSQVKRCINIGTIKSTNIINNIGGIVGRNYGGSCTINNCYNVGKIQYKSATYPGGVVGFNYNPGVVSNSYYLESTATKALNGDTTNVTDCTSKTSDQMKETSFINLMETGNEEADKPVWLSDTTNMNGGYPILAWQREE